MVTVLEIEMLQTFNREENPTDNYGTSLQVNEIFLILAKQKAGHEGIGLTILKN